MKRRRVLSVLGYTGLGVSAFTLGIALQRPELMHALLGHHDHDSISSPAGGKDPNFVMPATLPDFSYPDALGDTHSLSDWAGKHLLINFWATWCGPCREEIPLLIDMQSRFASQLQVVGLALDRVEPVRLFGDEYGMNYPSLVPGQDAGFALLERFQPAAMLPFSLLVDRQRNIVSSKLGAYKGDDLINELTQLMPGS